MRPRWRHGGGAGGRDRGNPAARVHLRGTAAGQLRVRGRSGAGAEPAWLRATGRVHAGVELRARHEELGHREPDGRCAAGGARGARAAGGRHPRYRPDAGLHPQLPDRAGCHAGRTARSWTSRRGARWRARPTSWASPSRTCSSSATASTGPSVTGICRISGGSSCLRLRSICHATRPVACIPNSG